MNEETFCLYPIGHVRMDADGFFLELKSEFAPGLTALEEFSHVQLLWWAHLVDMDENWVLELEKPYKKGPDKIGVFATRSPQRPNPIGLSVAQILRVDSKSGRVYLSYIDAEDGTPILDLKPYHPSADRVREAVYPNWCSHWPTCYEDSAYFDWESEFIS